MSSCSRRAALISLAALAGCGFTPLYGTGSAARGVLGRIAVGDVRRGELPDRMTFTLTDRLREKLGAAPSPAYRLDIDLAVREEELGITRGNDITRYNLTAVALWRLRGAGAGAGPQVLDGTATSYTAYSSTATVYSTRIAARDAEVRMARDLADKIAIQIAARADRLPA